MRETIVYFDVDFLSQKCELCWISHVMIGMHMHMRDNFAGMEGERVLGFEKRKGFKG